MKKAVKKLAKKRPTLKSLADGIANLNQIATDQAQSINQFRMELEYATRQIGELPKIRLTANEAYEEIEQIRALVARKYQLDVDAGVAEFIAKQKRDIANKGAIED
jgi:Tfp pilus assembly protein PilO